MKFTEAAKNLYGDRENEILMCFAEYIKNHGFVIPEKTEIELCVDGVVLKAHGEIILVMGVVPWAALRVEEVPAVKKYKAA